MKAKRSRNNNPPLTNNIKSNIMYTLLKQPSNVYLSSEISLLTNLYYNVVNGRVITNWFYNRKTIFTKNGMLTSSKF